MSEPFDETLREGTARLVDTLAPAPAAQLRAFGERRARSRRQRSLAACAAALLAIGGATAGAYRLHGPDTGPAANATASDGASRSATSPSASASPSAEATGPIQVGVAGPERYAAETANTVTVTLTNPGPQRNVIVEFDTTGKPIFEWAEGCDAGVDGGCSSTALASDPLQLTQGKLGQTPVQKVRFSLTLPHGTHAYEAWVNPPSGADTFSVRVLDEQAVKVFGIGQSAPMVTAFPSLTLASQASQSISRGGGYVQFSTTLSNPTGGGYIDLGQFGTVTCFANGSPVSVSADDYSLEWNSGGGGWLQLVDEQTTGHMSYDLKAGQSDTTRFRLELKGSLPAQVTSCQVTLTVSNTTKSTAPYYNTSQPKGQAVIDFTVH